MRDKQLPAACESGGAATEAQVAAVVATRVNNLDEHTTTARCNLFYDETSRNSRVVMGARGMGHDPTTKVAEAMTRSDFLAYQNKHVDTQTEQFIEDIRDAVLNCNNQGEFLSYGVSPAVLTDDWILRATEFVQQLQVRKGETSNTSASAAKKQQQQQKQLKLKLMQKRKCGCRFTEVWLLVEVVNGSGDFGVYCHDLPLLMFIPKQDNMMQFFLNKTMNQIHSAIEKSVSSSSCSGFDCQVLPVKDFKDMMLDSATSVYSWNTCPNEKVSAAADEIGVALRRLKDLRDRGASKDELLAEKKRVVQARRRRRCGANHQQPKYSISTPIVSPVSYTSNCGKNITNNIYNNLYNFMKDNGKISKMPVANIVQGADLDRMEEGSMQCHDDDNDNRAAPKTHFSTSPLVKTKLAYFFHWKPLSFAALTLWFIYFMMRSSPPTIT